MNILNNKDSDSDNESDDEFMKTRVKLEKEKGRQTGGLLKNKSSE